jgi:3-isopropylmalate dehydrogenase
VTTQGVRVLEALCPQLQITDLPFGGAALDRGLEPLPEETLRACLDADAVLLGAVGGPAWDRAPRRPEEGLLRLRRELSLWANLRPVRRTPAHLEVGPLKSEVVRGADILLLRELSGGLYYGRPREMIWSPGGRSARDTCTYSDREVARVVDLACQLSMHRRRLVTSVDKANVLATSRLWRETAQRIFDQYPEVTGGQALVDSFAPAMLCAPTAYDVVVTENMFGDILTDMASVIAGTLGMLPSASLGDGPGVFEPVHGSAPRLARRNLANPTGAILSVAMLLRYAAGGEDSAVAVEAAVSQAIATGARTADMAPPGGSHISTTEMGDEVLRCLRASLSQVA